MNLTIDTISFIVGVALFLYAVLDVEVSVSSIKLHRMGHSQRVRTSVIALIFTIVGIVFHYVPDGNAVLSVSTMIHSFDDVPNREATDFKNPTISNERLDICLIQGFGCGLDSANKWCRLHDFLISTSFQVDQVGLNKIRTISIGDNSICNNDTCTAFTSITCAR